MPLDGPAFTARYQRGCGVLGVEQQDELIRMLKSGASQGDVARHFGISKNVVAGIWARHGAPRQREPTTLAQRLDALHAKLDRVLAETRGVGRIPEPERKERR